MQNNSAHTTLQTCLNELLNVENILEALGDGTRAAPYLKKYSVIRASGSIELAFKTIIADKVDEGSHAQLKNFIKRKIRNSSSNPRLSIISGMLAEFDSRWKERFNELIAFDRPAFENAMAQLVDARNSFAHGGDSTLGIQETIGHFRKGIILMERLDAAVQPEEDHEAVAADIQIEEAV